VGRRSVEFENTGETVRVYLPGTVKKDEVVKVKIDHSVTQPPAGIYFTKADKQYPDRFRTVWTQGQDEDSRYYFPCLDKPNFKQSTEVILHLPKGMFGLSNGKLLSHKSSRTKERFHYKLEIPYSTYLLSIVAGDFAGHTERLGGVEIKWYVQKGREQEGKYAFRDTGKIVRFFSKYTGYPYPYSHYTQIAVPEFIFGGMENFTVTTQTDLTLHDKRAALDGDSNGLVAHEAAHTWFGDLVTAKNWSHAWLHESFATYFDALYTRESKGEDEFHYQLLQDAETYFSEDESYRRPIVTNVYKEPIDLFDAHLYPGGAVRLHHLISIVGEDLFRDVLKLYLKRHEFGLVETVDLVRCLEEVTGRNFDEWFDQWIYRGGYPRLEIKFSWDQKLKLATVEIKQTQKPDNKKEDLLFKLPFEIAFHFSQAEERYPVEINKREEKFCFKLKSKPIFISIDPDNTCPCKKVALEVSRPMLHEQLKRDQNSMGRIQAALALTKNASVADIKILNACLGKEQQWGVANRIAMALAKIGGNHARDGLLRALKNPHAKIRLGVVRALSDFKEDEKVAKALRKISESDPSYRVEASALEALGSIRDKKSREYLESALDRPSHNHMAQTAIYNALTSLEDEASWDVLVAGAEYGSHANSRLAAMRGLARLAKRFEHRRGEVVKLLQRFARESRGTPAAVFRGKLGAIISLKIVDDLSGVPTLRNLAENETDGRIKRRAEETVTALFESAKKPR
jgi:aminopeptidase N